MHPDLPRRQLLLYSALALPTAFAGVPLYLYAPDFYATYGGLSLAALGTMLLVLRAFDALQDPLLGHLFDRQRHHIPLLMAGAAVTMVMGFALLFHPPSQAHPFWFFITMLLTTTAYSLLTIGLQALGSGMTRHAHLQTRITSSREAMGLAGLLIAIASPALLPTLLPGIAPFTIMSLLLGLLMLLGMAAFRRWWQNHQEHPLPLQPSLWQALTHLPPQLRRLLLCYSVSMLASAIPAVLVLFFIRDRLGLESYTGLLLLTYFLSGILCLPLWQKLSTRLGIPTSWALAMILAVITFGGALMVSPGDLTFFMIICLFSGAALGADLALPPALLGVILSRTEMPHGMAFSLLTFVNKACLAVAAALTLPLLEMAGFRPAQPNSPEALHALTLVYAALPCLLKCLAALLCWRLLSPLIKDVYDALPSPVTRSYPHA